MVTFCTIQKGRKKERKKEREREREREKERKKCFNESVCFLHVLSYEQMKQMVLKYVLERKGFLPFDFFETLRNILQFLKDVESFNWERMNYVNRKA